VQADWAGQVGPADEGPEIHLVERGPAQMERRRNIEWPNVGIDRESSALEQSAEFDAGPAAGQLSVSFYLLHSAHAVAELVQLDPGGGDRLGGCYTPARQ
jgi:hypothetical protein